MQPIMFSGMSYGSISLNAHKALAQAAQTLGTYALVRVKVGYIEIFTNMEKIPLYKWLWDDLVCTKPI